MAAAQEAAQIFRFLNRLGPRTATAFRRHRVDGVAQKEIAVELGVSLSTVESDLRTAYRALREWKERRDGRAAPAQARDRRARCRRRADGDGHRSPCPQHP